MKALCTVILLGLISFYTKAQEISYTVLFEYDKYHVPDTALRSIVRIINQHKVERILLEGHCDNIGSREYNYKLSDNRANEVRKLLILNGIQKENIKKCIGFGKDKPLTLNETEQERQINRRVLITFFYTEEKKIPLKDTVVKVVAAKKPVDNEMAKIIDANVGDNIVLDNILFEPARHRLKEESIVNLQILYNTLKEYPTLEIEIQGHVCCATTEPDGYDWDTETNNLSVMRAREIYFILIRSGIDKNRLKYRGFGGSRKINQDESTEELRRVNRRVEIKILKK